MCVCSYFQCIAVLPAGVPREAIYKQIENKKYNAQLMGGRTISGLLSAAAPFISSSFESDPKSRVRRLAECSTLARIKDDSAVGRSEHLPEGKASTQVQRRERDD
jgi:hypothetical protein